MPIELGHEVFLTIETQLDSQLRETQSAIRRARLHTSNLTEYHKHLTRKRKQFKELAKFGLFQPIVTGQID